MISWIKIKFCTRRETSTIVVKDMYGTKIRIKRGVKPGREI